MAEVDFTPSELREIAESIDIQALAEHVNIDELADLVVEKLKQEEEAPEEDGEEVSSLSTRMDDLEDTAETAIRENDEAHMQVRALANEYHSELSHRCEELEEEVRHLKEQLEKLEPVLRLVKKLERFLG